MIDAAVNNAVGGLKSKTANCSESSKESSEKLKEFDGIDAGAVRNILQRFSDDEEAKLIAGGKIDEVLNKRTERMKAGFDKELKAAADKVAAAEARAQKFTAACWKTTSGLKRNPLACIVPPSMMPSSARKPRLASTTTATWQPRTACSAKTANR